MVRVASLLMLLLSVSTVSHAVEIKNALSKQDGNSVILTYDLPGKPGEKKAVVKIALMIGGERYTPDRVTVSGDFGSNVSIGLRKKIIWNVLKDMPAGYQGDMSWEIDADAEIHDPFNMYAKNKKVKPPIIAGETISDPASKLTWYRNANKLKKTDSAEEANVLIARLNSTNLGGYNDWRIPKKSEIESLVKLVRGYGYADGQSMFNYLGKVGFQVTENIKIWAIDKSNTERSSSTVYVSSTGKVDGNIRSVSSGSRTYASRENYNDNNNSYRSTGQSAGNSERATAFSGDLNYDGSRSVSRTPPDSGLYDVYLDSTTGYFMKQTTYQMVNILPVRGDGVSDIFAVTVTNNVNIVPQ